MNTYFSEDEPLLLSVFSYLSLNDIQRWRLTSHVRTEETNLHVRPETWDQHVCRTKMVLRCGYCRCLRSKNALVHCVGCGEAICAEKCTALHTFEVYCLSCIY
jgi:hypothetical protein